MAPKPPSKISLSLKHLDLLKGCWWLNSAIIFPPVFCSWSEQEDWV